MRASLIAVILLAGCATMDDDRMADNLRYEALGSEGWRLEIGDDIALWLGHNFVQFPDIWIRYRYPARPARTVDGGRRWRSGLAGHPILVATRPGPCSLGDDRQFPDHVRVTQGRRVLTGCGGPVTRP